MSEHTKTPWKLYQAGDNGRILSVYHEHKDDVIHWSGFDSSHADVEQQKANAAFIVRAVNSHETLIAELMAAQAQMNLAASCIQKGRYDEALLHVCSMSEEREAAIKLALPASPEQRKA